MQSSPLANRLPLSLKENAALSAGRGMTRREMSQANRYLIATRALTDEMALAFRLGFTDDFEVAVLSSWRYFQSSHCFTNP